MHCTKKAKYVDQGGVRRLLLNRFVVEEDQRGRVNLRHRQSGNYCDGGLRCTQPTKPADGHFRMKALAVRRPADAEPTPGVFRLYWHNRADGGRSPCYVDEENEGRLTCKRASDGGGSAQPFYILRARR